MNCINLQQKYGRRYRVEYEEPYFAEHGPDARVEDPALMVILCKWGEIFPARGMRLAASVGGYPKLVGRLRRLKCCRPHQDGDFGELTVLFEVADFPKVARIIRPRRRRRLSEPARRKLVEAGAKTRFQPGTQGRYTARRDASEAPDGSEHLGRQLGLFDG